MPDGKTGIASMPGSENNKIKAGQRNTLFGDPKIKPEKPYTIIGFPGGDVEISRTTDGKYWVHVAVKDGGAIESARLDAKGRYCPEANAALATEIEAGDIDHIAFLVSPPKTS